MRQSRRSDARRVGRGALVVPVTAGLVVLAYNVPGSRRTLKLPREVYADILRGGINRWDDPRIKQANPTLELPPRTIAVVARLDRSGTTFALTNHLSTILRAVGRRTGSRHARRMAARDDARAR